MKRYLSAVIVVVIFAPAGQAERPPQSREKATIAVSGTVKTLTSKESEFAGDGVRTDYTAEIVIDSVDKGDQVKAGDTITITWYKVTKSPTKPVVGAFGHRYDLKEKDKAKFWLMDRGLDVPKGTWVIIYNKDGVEKIDK